MKLAFFTTCGKPWGGSEMLWSSTARSALVRGHSVSISLPGHPRQDPRILELARMGAQMEYRRIYYPPVHRRAVKKLVNLFRRAGRKATYHDYLTRFGPKHIFFNLAAGDEIANDDDLMLFIRQTETPFSVMYHSVSKGNVLPEDLGVNMREVIDRSIHSFFTSRMQLEEYRSQLGHSIPNAAILHHPISNVKPRPYPPFHTGPIRFCMIGSLVKRWKGQDMAIEVLSQPRWRNRDWILNLYGEGEDREELSNLCVRSGIGDRVFFKGHEQNVGEVLGSHHLVLISSRQDSGPIVFFEAMHAARPVVGTPMGAMKEFILEGTTGFISDDIDLHGFSDAMERAWQSKEEWSRIGNEAYDRIIGVYDPNPTDTLLEYLVNGNTARPSDFSFHGSG